MILVLMGIVTGLNFIILLLKAQANRWADLTLDVFVLVVASMMGASTFNGLVVAMTASFFVSLFLYFFPPNLDEIFGENKEVDEFYKDI